MAWSTPETGWGVDVVNSSDMNAIGENLVTLHKGNGQASLTTVNPDASYQLGINATDETFIIDDNSNAYIDLILSTGREPGNRIQVLNQSGGNVGVRHNQDPSGNYKAINHYYTTVPYLIYPYATATFVYDGTIWTLMCNYPQGTL